MNDPDFFDQMQPKQPPRRKHGCLFYGCLTLVILAVLVAIGIFLVIRFLKGKRAEYTDTVPAVFPKSALTDEQATEVRARAKAFADAVKARETTEPLVLTADEINALIEGEPDMRGKFHVTIEGDKIGGQVSWPVVAGRYLNASAEARVSLKDGKLAVYIEKATNKGQPIPESFMQGFRQQNLAKDFTSNPENAAMVEKLESIEVKDGKLYIKARPKPKEEPEKGDQEKTEKAGEAKAEKPVEEKGAPAPDAAKPEPPKAEPGQAEPPKADAPKPGSETPKADSPKREEEAAVFIGGSGSIEWLMGAEV